jgi:hypothetical protein
LHASFFFISYIFEAFSSATCEAQHLNSLGSNLKVLMAFWIESMVDGSVLVRRPPAVISGAINLIAPKCDGE